MRDENLPIQANTYIGMENAVARLLVADNNHLQKFQNWRERNFALPNVHVGGGVASDASVLHRRSHGPAQEMRKEKKGDKVD